MLSNWFQALGAAVLGMVMAIACVAVADAIADDAAFDDDMARYIPYQGTVSRDGAAFDGAVAMTFRIFDGAGATAAVWEETQTVTVTGGRFNVLLGAASAASVANLASAVTAADDLYLSVSLTVDDEEVTLAGQQRLLPLPFALKSPSARALVVTGTALIESDADDYGTRIYLSSSDGASMEINGIGFNTQSGPLTVRAGGALTLGAQGFILGNGLEVADGLSLDAGTVMEDPLDADTLALTPSAVATDGVRLKGGATFGKSGSGATVVSGDLATNAFGHYAVGDAHFDGAVTVAGAATATTITAGTLDLQGTTDIGYHLKFNQNTGGVYCPSGTMIIGGGPKCSSSAGLRKSMPTEDGTGWIGACSDGKPEAITIACARVQ